MDDVLIIGAGPVGNYAALKLSELGHRVTVLEQQSAIAGDVCCSGIVGKECLAMCSMPEHLILREARGSTFYGPSGAPLRLEKATTEAYVIAREGFQRWLAEEAQRKGARYITDCRVQNIEIRKNEVNLDTTRGTMESAAVVVASGIGSRLSSRLGLGVIGDFTVGVQAEVSSHVDEVEVFFGRKIAPGFFAWLVPTTPGSALAGLFCRRDPNAHLTRFLEKLCADGKIGQPVGRSTRKLVPLSPLSRTYLPRVLVVGEAAGQVKPTTGGGIYYGLLGAQIATEVLHSSLETGDFSSRRMAVYQKRWQKKLGQEIQMGQFARTILQRIGDRQLDYVFGQIRSNGIHETLLNSPDFSFDWHGKLIMKGLKYEALNRPWRLVKAPFTGGHR